MSDMFSIQENPGMRISDWKRWERLCEQDKLKRVELVQQITKERQ
jgi:hypothetical protein